MTEPSQQRPTAVSELSPRLRRELVTVIAMIEMYCRAHHESDAPLCDQCTELKGYVTRRLVNCTYAGEKPTCAKCPVHCYNPARRTEIIKVMRFSGPRMVLSHPYLAFRHVLDGRRVVKKLSRSDSKTSSNQGESP